VLAVHPWLINARVKLAEIRLAQGQDEVAMREARMARSLNGDAPEPHVLMGELFARQGRTELAVGAFERAIDLTPDRWNPRAKIRAAEVLFAAQSDLPRVLRHLGEAEREAESDADLVARIAAVYSARGAPPEFLAKGRSLWERVARLRPHDPAAKLRVTVAPLLDGEPTPEELGRILEFLEGVITAQPDFDPARVRYFRGLALERMGRREDALRAYREATLLMGVGGLRQPGGDAHLDAAIEAMRALQSESRPEETR
jgi:tetratricopeptide (TPR) repeat protein